MTTGLRVSLRRAVPKIFEEHPLPWWLVSLPLSDNRGSLIHDDIGSRVDSPTTYEMHAVLWRLYVAMFPSCVWHIPQDAPIWMRIPIFRDYPAPWWRAECAINGASQRRICSPTDDLYGLGVIQEPWTFDGSKLYDAIWEMYQYINPTGRVIEA